MCLRALARHRVPITRIETEIHPLEAHPLSSSARSRPSRDALLKGCAAVARRQLARPESGRTPAFRSPRRKTLRVPPFGICTVNEAQTRRAARRGVNSAHTTQCQAFKPLAQSVAERHLNDDHRHLIELLRQQPKHLPGKSLEASVRRR